MRAVSVILTAILVLGLGMAVGSSLAAGKTTKHDVNAEFVSYDAKTLMVTFKDETGEKKTAPILESAVGALKEMKAGDQVVLTCTDDENGNHQAISKVKRAKKTSS